MSGTVELHIAERRPFADGHAFGDVGAYERLTGRAHFAVDPRIAGATPVWSISTRRRATTAGWCEFAADFMILKPVDLQRGNRRLFYRLRQPRPQARAAILQRRAAQQRPALARARRQRIPHAARLCGRLARLGGRHAAGRRPHGAGRAGCHRQRPADHRAVRVEYIADAAGHHHVSAQRQGRGAFLSPPCRWTRATRVLTRRRYPYDHAAGPDPARPWCFARIEGGRGGETQ